MRLKYLKVHEAECFHRGKFSSDKAMITIKLDNVVDWEEYQYRIKMTTKLSKLMSSQRSMVGLDLRFKFDTRRITVEENHTPRSLALEKDDVIEVLQEQWGS